MRKIISFLAVLLAVTALALTGIGCSAKAKKAYHLQKANTYFAAGQYSQAELEYLNVLRYDHENFTAISRLADMYFDEGRVQRAAAFIVEGHRLATNDLDMNLKLGIVYLGSGKVKEARELAGFVLDHNPKDDQAAQLLVQTAVTPAEIAATKKHLQRLLQAGDTAAIQIGLGTLALRAGDFKSAETAFKRAQTLEPKSSAAWSALGVLYLTQTNLTQAGDAFKTSSELAADRSAAKLQYASFKAQHGDPATARSLLQAILQKTPDFIPARMELAEIAGTEKKYDEAADLLHTVLTQDPDNFNALLASARVELSQGKIATATTDLERTTKLYAQAPQAHYLLGVAYLAANDNDNAVKSLTRAVTLNTNYPDASLLLDSLRLRTGNVDAAILSLKKLAQQYPQVAQVQLMLAGGYRARGNFDEALTIYRRLATAYPTNSELPTLAGMTLAQQKNNPEARAAFMQALKLAPDNFTALERLVALDLSEKQYSAAAQAVQPALEKFPKQAAPHLLQAQIFIASGDTNQAEATLLKTVGLAPEVEDSYMLLANLYLNAHENQKALAQLKIAATKNTNDITPFFLTGEVLNDQKDYQAAADAYEKVLLINPKFLPALNNLAYLYSEFLNKLDRAYDLAQQARNLQPNDAATEDTLGWILCKRGQYASALALLQDSARQLPAQPEVQYHLGQVNYFLGNADAAGAAFQQALQSGQSFRGKDDCTTCLAVLAVNVNTAGAEAQQLLEKRAAEQPDDVIALSRLAAIEERSGQTAKAMAAFEALLKADPKNVTALIHLARMYAPNDLSKAYDYANNAYKLAPDAPGVTDTFGHLAYQKGNYQLAYSLLQSASQNQSGNPYVLYDFARAAYSVGKVPEAKTAMQAALQTGTGFGGTNEAKRFLNLTALADNPAQMLAAATLVGDILKTEPNYVPALLIQAGIQAQKNDFNGAKQTYLKVLDQFPDFVPAQKDLAVLLANNPVNDPQAYDFATKARAAYPSDASVAKALGIILYRQADYPRAERMLQESAGTLAGDPDVWYYLGMTQYQLKKGTAAKQSLQKALGLNLSERYSQEARRVLTGLK